MSHGFTLADAQAHAEKHGYKLEFEEFRATYGDKIAIKALEKSAIAHGPAHRATETLRKAREPNKTEAEFGRILEAMKRRGEIDEYRYEGITLRWADMKYTPDWLVMTNLVQTGLFIVCIEVKGGHIWDRDIVRFKGARAAWPMFAFEMHQKKGGEWRRLH